MKIKERSRELPWYYKYLPKKFRIWLLKRRLLKTLREYYEAKKANGSGVMIVYFKNGDIASTDLPLDAIFNLYQDALENKNHSTIRVEVRYAGIVRLVDILELDIARTTGLPKVEEF